MRSWIGCCLAVVLTASACSGNPRTGSASPAPEPKPISVDWAAPALHLGLESGWILLKCPDKNLTMCVERNGKQSGSIDMSDVPSLGEEKTTSAEQIQAVLAGRIQTEYEQMKNQRGEECGPAYRVRVRPPKPVKVAGRQGVKYSLSGSAGGIVYETIVGYRVFRDGIESIIQARGFQPGGCPGAQPMAFSPVGLRSFEPLLDRLAAGSRLPPATKFSPDPSPPSPSALPTPVPTAQPRPSPTPTRTLPAASGSVTGIAVAGPVCPVERIPPDPACAPRPVAGARLKATDQSGREVAETTTDSAGRFRLTLVPGSYRLVPQPVQGLMGTAGAMDFQVGDGPVDLTVNYDTGIR